MLQFTVAPVPMTEPPFATLSVSVVGELPDVRVWLEGESVTVGTVTVAVAVCVEAPPAGALVAVMVAVPLPTAVTDAVARPVETTVATAGLLDVQLEIVPVKLEAVSVAGVLGPTTVEFGEMLIGLTVMV